MEIGRTIAVLHDSPDFGGHELAFLTWLPALLDSPRIAALHFSVPQVNAAFLSALSGFAHPKLHVSAGRFFKNRGEPYRAPFRFVYGKAARAFVAQSRADLVLLLQGRIENLATPMLWLPSGMELVSYVPMAHSGAEMGRARLLAGATDLVKRTYYRRPQRLIVPSRAVAAQARRAGARAPIYVVENIPAPRQALDRGAARGALGLPSGARIALFMGRFDAHQKGLDRLLRDLRGCGEALEDWMFLFVGQGPAEAEIRALFDDGAIRGRVVGWTTDPDRYLAASDVLIAPSRHEGVPLVLLEALQRGVPILASDIDVYREYLPEFALRDFSRPVDIRLALEQLTTASFLDSYSAHARVISERLDIRSSQRRFLEGLLGGDDGADPMTSA